MQGFADELVGDVRAVELGGIDVVDAKFDSAPQHRQRLVAVAWRPERTGPRQLDRAEANARDGKATKRKGIHSTRLTSSSQRRLGRWWHVAPQRPSGDPCIASLI